MINKELTASERGAYDEEEQREMPGMPRDLVLAVARDMHAMEIYARLSEGERAAFLSLTRQTPGGEPMQKLVRDLRYGEINI